MPRASAAFAVLFQTHHGDSTCWTGPAARDAFRCQFSYSSVAELSSSPSHACLLQSPFASAPFTPWRHWCVSTFSSFILERIFLPAKRVVGPITVLAALGGAVIRCESALTMLAFPSTRASPRGTAMTIRRRDWRYRYSTVPISPGTRPVSEGQSDPAPSHSPLRCAKDAARHARHKGTPEIPASQAQALVGRSRHGFENPVGARQAQLAFSRAHAPSKHVWSSASIIIVACCARDVVCLAIERYERRTGPATPVTALSRDSHLLA